MMQKLPELEILKSSSSGGIETKCNNETAATNGNWMYSVNPDDFPPFAMAAIWMNSGVSCLR
jgi:hypothetical protein